MEINIIKATEKHFKQAQKLSKKCLMKTKNGSINKIGIYKEINSSNLQGLYVALNQQNKVVGAIVCNNLEAEEDLNWFDLKVDEKAVEITRLCVDKKYRGQGIGQQLIEQLKQKFKGYIFCADVLVKPVENISSIKTVTKCGFKKAKEQDWFHKEWNTTFTYGIYKLENY